MAPSVPVVKDNASHVLQFEMSHRMRLGDVVIALSLLATVFSYQSYSIVDQMRPTSLAFTQNEEYLIATQRNNYDSTAPTLGINYLSCLPMLMLKRGRQGYEVVDRMYGSKRDLTIPETPISLSKTTGRFVVSWNDSYVRIYAIRQQLMQEIQKIEKTRLTQSFISEDGNIVFIMEATRQATFYRWDPLTQQYGVLLQKIYIPMDIAPSPDFKVLLSTTSDRKLSLFTYDGVTYKNSFGELVGQVSFPNSTIQLVSNPLQDGLRNVILVATDYRKEKGSAAVGVFTYAYYSQLLFCTLNGSTLTYIHTIYQFYGSQVHRLYMTQNSKFLALTFSYYSKEILVFRYSELTNRYQLRRRYTVSSFLEGVTLSEDGNLIVGASSIWISNNYEIAAQLIFFVECPIQDCELCSLQNNTCTVCKGELVPKGNQCVCEPHKIMVDSQCVDCLISHCLLCRKKDQCEECGNGYSLIEGVCLCPSYKNISEITKNCISCKVDGCVKCDMPNICTKFSDGLSGEHISYSFDVQSKLSDAQRASGMKQSVIIYREKQTPSGTDGKTTSKDEQLKPKQVEVVEVKSEQVKQVKQGDTITVNLTRGEQIEGTIILFLMFIIVCLCKRCKKQRAANPPDELVQEKEVSRKDYTSHEIGSKRDSEALG